MNRCRRPGCGEHILWVPHEDTGKVAPIDAEPVAGGNIAITIVRDEHERIALGMTYRIVPKDEREGKVLHRNHYATCTNPPPRGRLKHKEEETNAHTQR